MRSWRKETSHGVGIFFETKSGVQTCALPIWVKDEIYDALRPAVAAARGELWLLSTPGKQEGFFLDRKSVV